MTVILTFTAAQSLARDIGWTLRREVPGEAALVIYPRGTGVDAGTAYFTDCPEDALRTAAHGDETAAARHVLATLDSLHEGEAERESAVRDALASDPEAEAPAPRTVDMTPTWESMAGAFAAVLECGTGEGREIARAEVSRMGALADERNALGRVLAAVNDALRPVANMHKADSSYVSREDMADAIAEAVASLDSMGAAGTPSHLAAGYMTLAERHALAVARAREDTESALAVALSELPFGMAEDWTLECEALAPEGGAAAFELLAEAIREADETPPAAFWTGADALAYAAGF